MIALSAARAVSSKENEDKSFNVSAGLSNEDELDRSYLIPNMENQMSTKMDTSQLMLT